ncbi:hypothetical protein [Nonomuraea pusilla]|uniref:Excreted virulence factor EspC, type VII ESX diderm n=1 Tax=Nonomuraea pusilla TaxID=46177 RepID=A0A1H7U6Q3_9ACTN|nr:hypothetical protein [Nonomuraea pusilla]SEL92338.1 hypothetical protein SAMN05660976_03679 [Nonomuraea pusilla]
MSGYYVRAQSLRDQAVAYDKHAVDVTDVRNTLRAAFDRDRSSLGNDEYGAELAKKLPGIESGIFDGFKAFIDELEGIATGLRANAGNYERADSPGSRDA